MWCNTTTNKCYTCDSNCATCAGSSDSAKCTSCADSGKYVLATSSRRYGPCITKKLCVVPRYRDDSNKMCYTDTCPADASCQQCSVPCDGCFESNSVTSCVNCSLSTEIMSSETGKCIKSTACIYSAYRDDTLKVCYQSIDPLTYPVSIGKCPTGSTHCFLCDSTCAGCTAERSAYNCLGCSDSSKYLMLYPDSVDGMCVELAHCPPYRDELNKKCYVCIDPKAKPMCVASCPTNSTTCFQCDDTCSTCTSSRNTTACKGCSDSSMYLSKSTINSVVGTCLTKTGAASLTSAFVDATNMFIYSGKIVSEDLGIDGKCPTGTFRNVTSKQCLSCSSDCGVKGCTVSGGADKCNDCSDSTKYLFIDLKLNASSGPCIPEAACAIPYLKDPSSKTCYNSNTCPDGMYLEPTNYYCYRTHRSNSE